MANDLGRRPSRRTTQENLTPEDGNPEGTLPRRIPKMESFSHSKHPYMLTMEERYLKGIHKRTQRSRLIELNGHSIICTS